MGIEFFEEDRIFKLDTPRSSYIISIVDEENFIGHAYYGKKCRDHHLGYLCRTKEAPFVPSKNARDRLSFLDAFPFEYSTHGLGDYRESCISVKAPGGQSAVSFGYTGHRIYKGKPKLEGLPATFGTEEECSTLELYCEDKVLNMEATLFYSVFEDTDVIARSVKITNKGKEPFYLTKALSACLELDDQDFELLTMHGSWGKRT